MNSPAVSVIIPTYNRAHLIGRAIESALNACAEEDDIIVVDDGSTDDTARVLSTYGERIRYFKTENQGLASARNFGIRQSDKDLVAFLDDDDEWIPEKLTLQRRIMQARPDVLFCFSNFYSLFSNGKRRDHCVFNWGQDVQCWQTVTGTAGEPYSSIAELPETIDEFKVYIGDIYYHQMLDDYVLPTTMVVRRTPDFDPACFVEGLRFLESWTYSSHLARLGTAAYLDMDTACQHGHDGPRLTDAPTLLQIAAKVRVLEGQWGQDDAFLARHGARFYRRLDDERLLLIKELIASVKLRQARQELAKLHGTAPALLRTLARMPGALVRLVFLARSAAKNAVNIATRSVAKAGRP